jgi:hypothetical protein
LREAGGAELAAEPVRRLSDVIAEYDRLEITALWPRYARLH